MKLCPVCNVILADDYTGLCPNTECAWEFELFSSDLSQEIQTEYEKKLIKIQRLYKTFMSRSTIEDTKSINQKKDGEIVTCDFLNGDKYTGTVKDGKPNGFGVYFYADGDKYEGEFKDGKKNGRGILYSTNGNKYEHEFRDGIFNA